MTIFSKNVAHNGMREEHSKTATLPTYEADRRKVWIDALRGLLILLVVYAHSLQQDGIDPTRISWGAINSFHMPAFFAISGYVCSRERLTASYLRRRASFILIPFLLWTILGGILLHHENPILSVTDAVLHPTKSYWFLIILFYAQLAFFAVIRHTRTLNATAETLLVFGIAILLRAASALTGSDLLGFDLFAYYFFYFAIGFYLSDSKYAPSLPLAIGSICLWAIMVTLHSPFAPFEQSILGSSAITSLLSWGYRYAVALLAIVSLWGLSPLLLNRSESKSIRLLSYFGKVSLGIYVLHIFIEDGVRNGLAHFAFLPHDTGYALADFLIKMTGSLIIIKVLSYSRWTSRYLLGKPTVRTRNPNN